MAERFLAESAELRELVGDIDSTWLWPSDIRTRWSESFSSYRFTVLVRGTNGNAYVLFVFAKRGKDQQWRIEEALSDGPERVNLLRNSG